LWVFFHFEASFVIGWFGSYVIDHRTFLTASDRTEKDDCFCFSKRQLTVAEIADLVAEETDDTGLDPDYSDREDDDSGSDGDDGDSGEEGEVRVYMDPPIERGEADTDRDSGKSLRDCGKCEGERVEN
jgi:hypothetical protein